MSHWSAERQLWHGAQLAPPYQMQSAQASKRYPDVAVSDDEQTSAKLCCVEIDEVAVAFGPPT
jgi:hypothetical protein